MNKRNGERPRKGVYQFRSFSFNKRNELALKKEYHFSRQNKIHSWWSSKILFYFHWENTLGEQQRPVLVTPSNHIVTSREYKVGNVFAMNTYRSLHDAHEYPSWKLWGSVTQFVTYVWSISSPWALDLNFTQLSAKGPIILNILFNKMFNKTRFSYLTT